MPDAYTLDPRNARTRDARAKEIIRKSLETFGAGRSITIDAENVVISGNGVYEQAIALGIPVREVETDGTELIVVKRTDLVTSEPKRIGLALADNQTATLAKWDEPVLEELKAELLGEIEFEAMGFVGDAFDVEGVDAPQLQDGDRSPFQQMTFTLHDEQVEVVKSAVEKAKHAGHGESAVNENSNGNALAAICGDYRG